MISIRYKRHCDKGHIMNALYIIFLLLFTSWNISAVEISAIIYDIIEPEQAETTYLVLTLDGHVYEINENEVDIIYLAYGAKDSNAEVIIDIEDESLKGILGFIENILSIRLLSLNNLEKVNHINFEIPHPLDNYEISVLDNYETAFQLFLTQNKKTRGRSQCYNRAHVWTYELSDRINAGKVFLFFTRRYIREFRYRWWFHVSPYTKVLGESEEIILDREFLKAPLRITDWKNIFMANQAHCPSVDLYTDYRQNQFSHYCYFIKASMYYWQPYNIENLENGSPAKTEYINSELRRAYRDGFGIRNPRFK